MEAGERRAAAAPADSRPASAVGGGPVEAGGCVLTAPTAMAGPGPHSRRTMLSSRPGLMRCRSVRRALAADWSPPRGRDAIGLHPGAPSSRTARPSWPLCTGSCRRQTDGLLVWVLLIVAGILLWAGGTFLLDVWMGRPRRRAAMVGPVPDGSFGVQAVASWRRGRPQSRWSRRPGCWRGRPRRSVRPARGCLGRDRPGLVRWGWSRATASAIFARTRGSPPQRP